MPPTSLNLSPNTKGAPVAVVEVTAPPGNTGRRLAAALKLNGRVLARGESSISKRDIVQLTLLSEDSALTLSNGNYELWVTIDRDGLLSWYPGFTDIYVKEMWQLPEVPCVKRIMASSGWLEKRPSKPGNILRIHYHRYDGDYDNFGLWTWSANAQDQHYETEIFEIGRDEFGLIFELDRADYCDGGELRIGLLPRQAGDWNLKDGADKIWHPYLGNEIYLIGTRDEIWKERPNTDPELVAAFIDTPHCLVIQLSRLVEPSEVSTGITKIADDQCGRAAPFAQWLILCNKDKRSSYLKVVTLDHLDVVHRTYSIQVDGFGGALTALPREILDDQNLFYNHAAELGTTYSPFETIFRVFAPTARAMHVVLYDALNGTADGRVIHPLRRADKGIWEGIVSGDLNGRFYRYRVDVSGLPSNCEVLDPYCINAVASSSYARITALAETNPPDWEKYRAGPPLQSPVDMVIYEIHVRDFSIAANSGIEHKGRYLGFTETSSRLPSDPHISTGLDHLVELGITHVQLMPVQDFENIETSEAYNWGYMTVAFNSPEGWFASETNNDYRIHELKQLIRALHARGIGVILDVVYNHTAHSAPFNALVPHYYYRFLINGIYANGSGCGNEFRSESPMGRKYILDSLKYWVHEYGIDGFRFDLMALIDFDTMLEVERELHRIKPDIVLYGEPWAAGASPMKGRSTDQHAVRSTKIAAFNDHFRNALSGSPDGSDLGFIQNGSRREQVILGLKGVWQDRGHPCNSINYMTCHDNLVLYDKLRLSKPSVPKEQIIEMMKLGYLLLFTAQGVPFIHGGEEFARTKNGHHNSYNASDEVNQVNWSLKKKHHDLFIYVRNLIALRKTHPLFRLRTAEQIEARLKFQDTRNDNTLVYTIDGHGLDQESWGQVCVLINADDPLNVEFELPEGLWHIAFDYKGLVRHSRTAENVIGVRYKSGMILYQKPTQRRSADIPDRRLFRAVETMQHS